MLTFQGNIVGRANYTIRDYYHDTLKNKFSLELSQEEKEALEWLNTHDLCKCGHEKQEHSKFMSGKFAGCQTCKCVKFISYIE